MLTPPHVFATAHPPLVHTMIKTMTLIPSGCPLRVVVMKRWGRPGRDPGAVTDLGGSMRGTRLAGGMEGWRQECVRNLHHRHSSGILPLLQPLPPPPFSTNTRAQTRPMAVTFLQSFFATQRRCVCVCVGPVGPDRFLRRGCTESGVGHREVKALQVSRKMKNLDSGCRPVFWDELHLDSSPLCVSKGRQMQKAKHKVPYNKTE